MDKLKVHLRKLRYLNIMMNKCVSTIPDECRGVGLEISTNPKREATKVEHIVSTDGNIRVIRVELQIFGISMVLDNRKMDVVIFVP